MWLISEMAHSQHTRLVVKLTEPVLCSLHPFLPRPELMAFYMALLTFNTQSIIHQNPQQRPALCLPCTGNLVPRDKSDTAPTPRLWGMDGVGAQAENSTTEMSVCCPYLTSALASYFKTNNDAPIPSPPPADGLWEGGNVKERPALYFQKLIFHCFQKPEYFTVSKFISR